MRAVRLFVVWMLILGGCGSEPALQVPTSKPVVAADISSNTTTPDHPEPEPSTDPEQTSPNYLSAPVTSTDCDTTPPVILPTANSIYPGFDPESETVLMSPKSKTTQGSSLQDVVIRARFKVRRKLDATLLGRADANGGVGIVFEGTTAQLMRVSKNTKTPLSARFPIYRLEQRREIEVVLNFFGSLMIAQIFDAKTGLELLSILGLDESPQRGIPVVTSRTTPNLLTERSACKPVHLNAAEPVSRYITLNTADAQKLSGNPHFKVVEELGDMQVLETTIHGIELAHCSGVAMRDVRIEAPWKYVDPDYMTYRTLPPVRTESGFRVDLSYHSPDMVNVLLKAYAAEFPTRVRLEMLGTSHAGRPIYAVAVAQEIKTNDPRPAIFLNGGHHGDEPLSTTIVLDALQTLLTSKDPVIARANKEFVVWLVPLINPDGAFEFLERSRYDGRKVPQDLNGDGRIDKREGVDLNRNYPLAWGSLKHVELDEMFGKWYRGPSPASEPETQAVMRLAHREHFVSAISFHTGTTAVLAPYTINSLTDPAPNETIAIAESISKSMDKDPNGRPFPYRKNLYAVEGTDQDWMRHTFGTAAFLIESAKTSPLGYCARKDALEPSRRAWQTLLARTLDGPFVFGYAPGQSIQFTRQSLNASEAWKTRPRDGFWGRYVDPSLIEDGKVRLVFKDGETEVRQSIQILEGMTHASP